jgi:hypothetical protein
MKIRKDGVLETQNVNTSSEYTDDGDWTALTSKHSLVGGIYQSTPGTITDGDTGPFRVDEKGHIITSPHSESVALPDNASNTQNVWVDAASNLVPTPAFGYNFDGSTWDGMRGDATDGLLVNLGSNNDVDTELPAAAALADFSGNPTVPGIGSHLMVFDGTNWNRARATLPTDNTNLLVPTIQCQTFGMLFDGSTWDRWRGDSTNGALVDLGANNDVVCAGDVAHDSADSGNPVKLGAKSTDYEPDTEDEQGQAEVAASDRVDIAANLRGEIITAVNPMYTTLDNLADTYDDVTSTNTSQNIECWKYRVCTIAFELDKANTPTDITFTVEISLDGTNFTKMMNGGLGLWIYDDVTVGTGIERSYTFFIGAQLLRVKVDAAGTTATNTFTVANSFAYFRT